jgi:hypothetical protein
MALVIKSTRLVQLAAAGLLAACGIFGPDDSSPGPAKADLQYWPSMVTPATSSSHLRYGSER